uniref:Uncharacterized protein n=1 Tax=Arundo donax TaxID=35708 RepID=A0A0A9G758_ARUDO
MGIAPVRWWWRRRTAAEQGFGKRGLEFCDLYCCWCWSSAENRFNRGRRK